LAGTSLQEVAQAFNIPTAQRGSLEEFRAAGAHLDFRGNCPGYPPEGGTDT
jgi:hypothetical protein